MTAKVWTDERIAMAARLRKSGMEYGAIAKVIGSTEATTRRIFVRYRAKFAEKGVAVAHHPKRARPKQPEVKSYSLRSNEPAFAAAMAGATFADQQCKPQRILRDHVFVMPFTADHKTMGGVSA